MSLSIGAVDLVIVGLYMAGVTALGLWFGRGQRTAADYLLGGRDLPWWAVLLSIVATETSTVTFLSIPGVAYAAGGDLRFLQLAFGYILGRFVIVYLFLPHYFQGDLYTAYDVLHRRFGGAARQTASLLFLVTRNLADGLRLFLTAIVLQEMIGLELTTCIAVMGAITIFYTFAGGMKSVVWTDCLQFAVYISGALLAGAILLRLLPGGWEQLVAFGQENHKFRIFDWGLRPGEIFGQPTPRIDFQERYTLLAGVFGGMFLSLATHGTDQLMVQRYLAARSLRDASRALGTSGFVVCAQFALFLLIGVGLACYYSAYPPESALPNDKAFARFLIAHMPVGVLGVTLAAVFSAAMSTLSSSLNSSAGAAVNDFYAPLRGEKSPTHLLWASRAFTVVFGGVQIGVAIGAVLVGLTQSVVDNVLAIASFTTGVMLGVFFLGVLTRRVSQTAALIGLLTGLIVMTYVAFGARLPEPWSKWGVEIAWPWWALIGSMVTFLVGLAASWIWPQKASHV